MERDNADLIHRTMPRKRESSNIFILKYTTADVNKFTDEEFL
jgi:hypothetical protein